MSRLALKPFTFPSSVSCKTQGDEIIVSSGNKQLRVQYHPNFLGIDLQESSIKFTQKPDVRIPQKYKGILGTVLANFKLAVKDVTSEPVCKMVLSGVGYKASVSNAGSSKYLKLSLGFSHPLFVYIPKDISITVEGAVITVKGVTTQQVTSFCAMVKKYRKPTAYHGTGIAIQGAFVYRKAGKKK